QTQRCHLIGIHDPDRLRGAGVQVPCDAGQREVDDGAVQHRQRNAENDDRHCVVTRRRGQTVLNGHGELAGAHSLWRAQNLNIGRGEYYLAPIRSPDIVTGRRGHLPGGAQKPIGLVDAPSGLNPIASGVGASDTTRRRVWRIQRLAVRTTNKGARSMKRRNFDKALAATALGALAPFQIARAQSKKLRVGMLLPLSGYEGFIGQSCKKGSDLAPGVIKELTGVDIELMNADTESNVQTARSRAERLIDEGANVLVGAFDSGATAAIAQVAEQRGVPFVVNIAAAPQITEQGYKFVFRNFPTAVELLRNGLSLVGDLFQATNETPRTAVYMHVNDTFGQAMTKGIDAMLPKLTRLPFKIVEEVAYDPATKDLSVEVAKAKAS